MNQALFEEFDRVADYVAYTMTKKGVAKHKTNVEAAAVVLKVIEDLKKQVAEGASSEADIRVPKITGIEVEFS